MSSAGERSRKLPLRIEVPKITLKKGVYGGSETVTLKEGKQFTVSESHSRDRKTGNYYAGGPFYTSRATWFIQPGSVRDLVWTSGANRFFYTGPVCGAFPTSGEMKTHGFSNPALNYGDKNESSLQSLGTTAISLTSPTNPASDLGTSLAEIHREGIPSLPGIETWKRRTEILKGLGSEYLNYQFGWAPLKDEVSSVRDAARRHRDIMNSYHRNEGRNTHRTFHFPSESSNHFADVGGEWPLLIGGFPSTAADGQTIGRRVISRVRETKRWFEGCYTYGLPSSSDSWRKAIGFGSDADQLFGLTLTPDVLWELTPWSWAVDWFSNAGEVVNNVTNIGLAGLVLRYGYMMEESIERITATVGPSSFYTENGKKEIVRGNMTSSASCGVEVVTKRRIPASPFGFSIGWEGLSPTQLAITAALGITKLL